MTFCWVKSEKTELVDVHIAQKWRMWCQTGAPCAGLVEALTLQGREVPWEDGF